MQAHLFPPPAAPCAAPDASDIPVALAAQFAALPGDWQTLLQDFTRTSAWPLLCARVDSARQHNGNTIQPAPAHTFRALHLTPLKRVRIVILGQDPYNTPGLAQGLAFSIPAQVAAGTRAFPSSLNNIFKAIRLDGGSPPPNGDLSGWAQQGVLLLNTILTVETGRGNAGSHAGMGWEAFTDFLIQRLADSSAPGLIWMLWGRLAQQKAPLITASAHPHVLLRASHPSGLGVYRTAQPFLLPGDQGSCGHFRTANQHLAAAGGAPIDWSRGAN